MRFTPNGPAVMDRVIRMSSRNRSGGTSAAPRVPMPPALETAATSGGVVTKPIPAPMNGTSSPYASVKRVRNIFCPFSSCLLSCFLLPSCLCGSHLFDLFSSPSLSGTDIALPHSKAHPAGFGATPQLMHLGLADPSIRRKRHESAMSIVMNSIMGSGPKHWPPPERERAWQQAHLFQAERGFRREKSRDPYLG